MACLYRFLFILIFCLNVSPILQAQELPDPSNYTPPPVVTEPAQPAEDIAQDPKPVETESPAEEIKSLSLEEIEGTTEAPPPKKAIEKKAVTLKQPPQLITHVSIPKSTLEAALNSPTQGKVIYYKVHGEIKGLIIADLGGESLFSVLHLEKGDILLELEGTPLISQENLKEFYKTARTRPSFELKIMRQKKERLLKVNK